MTPGRRSPAEDELAELRSMRSVRLGLAISETVGDRRLSRLPSRIAAALRRPTKVDTTGGVPVVPGLAYGHLRVTGDPRRFARLVTPATDDHVDIAFGRRDDRAAHHVSWIGGSGDLAAAEQADLGVVIDRRLENAAIDALGPHRVIVQDYSIDLHGAELVSPIEAFEGSGCVFVADDATDGPAVLRSVAQTSDIAVITGSTTADAGGTPRSKPSPVAASAGFGFVLVDRRAHANEADFADHVLRLGAAGRLIVHRGDPLVERLLPDGTTKWTGGQIVLPDTQASKRAMATVRRHVVQRHGLDTAFEGVLTALGLPVRRPAPVSVVMATRRPSMLMDACSRIAAQSHPNLEVVIVAHGEGFDGELVDKAAKSVGHPFRVVHVSADRSFGEALNAGLDVASGEIVTKMDDDDWYGPGHIADLVTMLEATGADIVGRAPDFVYLGSSDETLMVDTGLAMRYGHHVAGPTLTTRRDTARTIRFEHRPSAVDQSFYDRAAASGRTILALDAFDFILVRGHGDHTWKARDDDFRAAAEARWSGFATDVAEIPVPTVGQSR